VPARSYALNQIPHTVWASKLPPRRLNKGHKENDKKFFISSLLLCRSDGGDSETASYLTVLNAGAESVAIRQVVSCNVRGIYSATYTKKDNRNLANLNTKWHSQHHVLSTGTCHLCSHSFSGSLYARGMRHKAIAMRTT